MDFGKIMQIAEQMSNQIPEGETKPLREMNDQTKMFQHTFNIVSKMMENGELNNVIP